MYALRIDGKVLPVKFQKASPFIFSLVVRDGIEIGHISWNEHTGQIWGLWVNDGYRREGIATMLYLIARKYEPRLHHSAERTDDGDAWAQSLGEKLPKRVMVAT